jgi:cation diffusion facilitator CzcD-associated flavoprotein CzcO
VLDPRVLAFERRLALRYLEREISDPVLRRQLTPTYAWGCKRILYTDDYLPALRRANVELIASPVASFTDRAIRAADGTEREVDAVIFGTGFDVLGSVSRLPLVGRDGVTLSDAWRGGAAAYLGTMVAGFPNVVLLLGPNTALGHSSLVFMIEAQLHWAQPILARLRRGARTVEVTAGAQDRFNARLQARLKRTVWQRGGCWSWYQDDRGHNFTLWPGSTAEFWLRTRRVRWADLRVA